MGAAKSKNIVSMITDSVTKVITNVVANAKITSDNTQVIYIEAEGDIDISGVEIEQNVTLNLKALQDALSNSNVQQSFINDIMQKAKAAISDINLLQFSEAESMIENIVKLSNEMYTAISQTCLAQISQTQKLYVRSINGNVRMNNTTIKQLSDISNQCSQNASANNALVQEIQNKFEQISESETKGISIWGIVALALVALLAVVLPIALPVLGLTSSVTSVILKIVYPIMMIVGIVFLILYFKGGKRVIGGYPFSRLFANQRACGDMRALGNNSNENYTDAIKAATACEQNSSCMAFDYQTTTVSEGVPTKLEKPRALFYSTKPSDQCLESMRNNKDKTDIIRMPKFTVSEKRPDKPSMREAYINPITTKIEQYARNANRWEFVSVIDKKYETNKEPIVRITDVNPNNLKLTDIKHGDLAIVYDRSQDAFMLEVFEYNSAQKFWQKLKDIHGPEPIANVDIDMNTSGAITVQKTSWQLYIGIGLLAIGGIGLISSFIFPRKPRTP